MFLCTELLSEAMLKLTYWNSVFHLFHHCPGIISFVHSVVCGRRPLLHGLKEAPELFRMVIPFTGANLVTRRATETVAEVIIFCCSIAPVDFAGSRHLSEFIPWRTQPFNSAPDNSTAPAHGWILKPLFQAISRIKENTNRYRGGSGWSGGWPAQAGGCSESTTDTPQHLNGCRPGAQVSFAAPTKKQGLSACAPGKAVSVLGYGVEAIIKRGKYRNSGAGDDEAGETGGRQP